MGDASCLISATVLPKPRRRHGDRATNGGWQFGHAPTPAPLVGAASAQQVRVPILALWRRATEKLPCPQPAKPQAVEELREELLQPGVVKEVHKGPCLPKVKKLHEGQLQPEVEDLREGLIQPVVGEELRDGLLVSEELRNELLQLGAVEVLRQPSPA